MLLQASSYGDEDVVPEGGDAVMTDKVTYTFDELVNQVQVPSLFLSLCYLVMIGLQYKDNFTSHEDRII